MSITVDITKKLAEYTFHIAFSAGNEFIGLLGASGSGKSMTLKCIAGIETPDEGYIAINGTSVFDSVKHINLRPRDRNTGYLFQNYALFPTMNVQENIAIVLHRLSRKAQLCRTAEILAQFGISELSQRKCSELSGGQMQRVALARMMVREPGIVMLDEPFSALDAFVRQQIEDEVSLLLKGFPGTVLFVSHNRDEVYRLCDSLRIIDHGQVCASGSTDSLFRNPRNVIAARLTGCKNITPCIKTGEHTLFAPEWALTLTVSEAVSDTVTSIGIRAHYIRSPAQGESVNVFEFSVVAVRPSLFSTSTFIAAPGAASELLWESTDHDAAEVHTTVHLCLPSDAIMLLSR